MNRPLGVVLALVAVLGAGCASGGQSVHEATATYQQQVRPQQASAAPTVPVPAAPVEAPRPEPVTAPQADPVDVARVIDGDTFELTDGRRVRVLGIDSCEKSTYGGEQALTAAEGQLTNPYNEPITMTREPGVDTDQYGRLLRYVQLDGADFGEFMVQYDHTGVYQGRNDASPDYIARLYAADTEYAANPPAGRACEDPYPTSSGGNSYEYDGDDDFNMPDGALTGGYCARKFWC